MMRKENKIKVLHDQHIHSSFSEDSKEDIKNYYNLAIQAGVSFLSTTEHVDYDIMGTGYDWMPDFEEQQASLKALNPTNDSSLPQPLFGVEIGYRRDYFGKLVNIVNRYHFDIIQLSIHGDHYCDYYEKEYFIESGIKPLITKYYEEMYDAVTSFPKYSVLSHLDYGYKTVRSIDPSYEFLSDKEQIVKVLKALIAKDKPLEINIKVQDTVGTDHTKELLRLYKSLGGKKLTLSSDAHQKERYRIHFDEYLKLIKEEGFDSVSYFVDLKEYQYYL